MLSWVIRQDISLHTNFGLMVCKQAVGKVVHGAPNEILLVFDGNTGLNSLPQARESMR
ncbi:hypothetical protein SLEP1_g2518 [Rubroshorea leprosula]|uniref:Uncharacterized protein n=1 Tax=Rubroshorea leprosula TaxID=152421 RepID=A0AAV5HNA0_9ROSI|nr:hypothetical protein SLEP1_g2518 [Rubroshorea leprosula]